MNPPDESPARTKRPWGVAEANNKSAETMKRTKFHPAFPYVSSQYGAPMGRHSQNPDDGSALGKVYLKKWAPSDGCYDEGGAYWGCGKPIYCAWSRSGFRRYFRASNRLEAIATASQLVNEFAKVAA